MTAKRLPTRQRLINAALELFASQGVTETTTRQIAELANVNEVTLFRQFGNKQGLVLAVIKESAVFSSLEKSLAQQSFQTGSLEQALRDYADSRLEALEAIPEFVRSFVGEAGQYPAENRQAIGREFTQANRFVAQYLESAINQGQLNTLLPAEKISSLLNSLLLGYAVLEFTSEFHQLWEDRQDFLENLVKLFLHGAVAHLPDSETNSMPLLTPNSHSTRVADIPPYMVHTILQTAKKLDVQIYALIYVLFGAGLSIQEIINLQRSHHVSNRHQHLLQITQGVIRPAPINQWIANKRYGSYTNNPLKQWLKSRQDDQSALFINEAEQPVTEEDICLCWRECTEGLLNPDASPLRIEQTQHTWRVDMLIRGVRLEDLSLLTGLPLAELQPYAHRAKERLALESAIHLDHKQ
ncbi:MAG: TetR/AcrR family transcriptional regulator [Leptolyngbyaceae cyanobacterium MO_188.B28]|nr:TetR/AcrR family transcriptional regulator [Leptolyngbyaceae cyanobacterium MO_188.B28]